MSNTERTIPESVVAKQPARPFQMRLRTREAWLPICFLHLSSFFFSFSSSEPLSRPSGMSFYDWQILGTKTSLYWAGQLPGIVWRLRLVDCRQKYGYFLGDDGCWHDGDRAAGAVAVTQKIRGAGFFRVLLYMPQLLSVGVVGLIWVWLLSTQFGVINYGLSFLGIHPINWLGDEKSGAPCAEFDDHLVGLWLPHADLYRRVAGYPRTPLRGGAELTARTVVRFSATSRCRCCARRSCL